MQKKSGRLYVKPRNICLLVFDLDSTLLRDWDDPRAGVLAFLNDALARGFYIVYLTARWKIIHPFSKRSLRNLIYPNGETVVLIEKINPFASVTKFKLEKIHLLDTTFKICGFFEDRFATIKSVAECFSFPIFTTKNSSKFSKNPIPHAIYLISDFTDPAIMKVIENYARSAP